MTIMQYDANDEILTFLCRGCSTDDYPVERKISLMDLSIDARRGSPVIVLPVCENCGSLSFIQPGRSVVGKASHIRGLLFKQLYVLSKFVEGSSTEKIGNVMSKLQLAYDNIAVDSISGPERENMKLEFNGTKKGVIIKNNLDSIKHNTSNGVHED